MSIGRKKLISKLEGIVYKNIYNNGNRIRYPITFKNGSKLKGNFILKITDENKEYFYTGRYIFGANELYIYNAIEQLLSYLENEADLDTSLLEDELEFD